MGGLEEQDSDHALDHVGRRRWPSPASPVWRASSRRTKSCGRRTVRRWDRRSLWVVGLATAAMTAFYMWRLMNMTFYGKSRVQPEVRRHIHESPASMTVPLTLLAIGSVLAGWLGTPKLWNLPRDLPRVRTLAGAGVRIEPAAESGARRPREYVHRMDADVAVGADRHHRHLRGPLSSITTSPTSPTRIETSFKPLHALLYNKWYVDEIYDFLFVNGLCKGGGLAAGLLRPQRGGWRRERRRLADALQPPRSRCGGTPGSSTARCASRSFFVKMLSYPVCILQTGRVQAYAFFVVVGVLALFGYYIVR